MIIFFVVSVLVNYIVLICFLVSAENMGTERVLWAIPGGDAHLPCNMTQPQSEGDAIGMVMWFRDATKMPLYTLDFRNGPPIHWAVADDLGGRSHFVIEESSPSDAHLTITKINKNDQGVYRCRIDFLNSPTKNFKVNLTIVEPPDEVRVYDAEGREILTPVAGPFREGYDLLLSCQVSGGNPRPEVTWWRGDQPLETLVDTSTRGSVISQLYLNALSRKMNGAKLQCRAETSVLLPAKIKEVTLKVYLKPQSVKVKGGNEVRAGHQKNFVCVTKGSRPAPNIDWFLDTMRIDSTKTTVEVDGDHIKSVLTWIPRRDDDNKNLSCRVNNAWFPAHYLEDGLQLNVLYAPLTNLTMATEQDPELLSEGDDTTLKCITKGKPRADNFTFYKEDGVLHTDTIAGFIINGSLLTLKNLQQYHTANYKCRAYNTEGYGDSNPFHINVLYRPSCASGNHVNYIRAAPGSLVRARCVVDAPPSSHGGHLRFYWTYNSTKDVLPIPTSNVTVNGNVSVAVHGIDENIKEIISDNNESSTEEEEELGWLACWASNDIGNQIKPCLYKVVTAGSVLPIQVGNNIKVVEIPSDLPSPPSNCEVNPDDLEVRCEPGNDGGLNQHFLLEVIEMVLTTTEAPHEYNDIVAMNDQASLSTANPVYRAKGRTPVFPLNVLPRGRRYALLVYSETARGRSQRPAVAHYVDSPAITSGIGPLQVLTPAPPTTNNSVALVIGAALSLVLLSILTALCVTIIIVCKKKPQNRNYDDRPDTRNVGVCMYSGGSVAATIPLQLGGVVFRSSNGDSTTNLRGSRVSSRWSNVMNDVPGAIAVLTPMNDDIQSGSSIEDDE